MKGIILKRRSKGKIMKRAMRFATFFICTSLTLLLITPLASALTRRTHLMNFIESTKTPLGGFQATALPSNTSANNPDVVSTSYAINMSLYFGKEIKDFIDTATWIVDNLKTLDSGFRIMTTDLNGTMKGMYHASMALNTTEKLSSLGSEFQTWITDRRNQTNGGFSEQKGGYPNALTTYYAIEALYYLGNVSILSTYEESLRYYFRNCSNADGGFAEIANESSSLKGTWLAVASLSRLASLQGFSLESEVDKTKTLEYVAQFYFSDPADEFNYGGYGTSGRATVWATYYAQKTYSLLGETNPNAAQIQNYLLSCQNSVDGGFAEKNVDGTYGTSAVITSFFAFDVLMTFDSKLGMLDVEVWFMPFDWVLLLIVIGIVIVAIYAVYRLYRKYHD
ncbi:MAG: hypothetical protein RBG13Loki_0584 [Promethearchaeota archaeon CR_4]|nr:MAG: hypothetical protein RBG13Loki_0584 [Candidatus Lokiarchaeota archaeon CR_4]